MAGAFHKGQDVGGIPSSTEAWPENCPQSGAGTWGSLTGYKSPSETIPQGGVGLPSPLRDKRGWARGRPECLAFDATSMGSLWQHGCAEQLR